MPFARETAKRVFAHELKDSTLSFKESDDTFAPGYVLLPSGEKANRVLMVGIMTDAENIGEDSDRYRCHMMDLSGASKPEDKYAGSVTINIDSQYQPEACAAITELAENLPCYVMVQGKPSIYKPADSDKVFVSVKPELLVQVDEAMYKNWHNETVNESIARLENVKNNKADPYVKKALEVYGDKTVDYKEMLKAVINEAEALGTETETAKVETEPATKKKKAKQSGF